MNGCVEFCRRQCWRVVLPVTQLMVALFGGVLPLTAAAASFQAAMDASRWTVDGSVHECRISHDIPRYGRAVFAHSAGENPRFRLLAQVPVARAGTAALLSAPPLWRPQGISHPLATVNITRGKQVLEVGGGLLKQLLAELLAGQELVFSGALTPSEEERAKVVLSPVNFRRAYEQYQHCLTALLPVNFEQIRRTALYFPGGSEQLPQRALTKLDNMALYVAADDSVQSFYVDGHTDSAGDRGANLDLSQRRAETVVSLLLARGIPLDKITTRWHGERYPVASNRTPEGQARNRRVTVRLERDEPDPAPVIKEKPRPQQRAEGHQPQGPNAVQRHAQVETGRGETAPWWLR